ncbi:hypothetical protein DFH09DRAFT_1311775 [Mycena vulgaris]|nr:hypothetical protein DFH09DRAFT_1311775 [Mycena vulgaris]
MSAFSAAHSKTLKKEAILTNDKTPRQGLQIWLDRQRFPLSAPGPRRESFYERKRAELVAKKAHIDALMELRARGLQTARHCWPRPRCLKVSSAKENMGIGSRGKARETAAREAREAAVAEAAREAWVAHLMHLRFGAHRK